jgi:hypothetical protein
VCRRDERPISAIARAERALDGSKRGGGDCQTTEEDLVGDRAGQGSRPHHTLAESSAPLRV